MIVQLYLKHSEMSEIASYLLQSNVTFLWRHLLLFEPRNQIADGLIAFNGHLLVQLVQKTATLVEHLLVQFVLFLPVLFLQRFLCIEYAELFEVLTKTTQSNQ